MRLMRILKGAGELFLLIIGGQNNGGRPERMLWADWNAGKTKVLVIASGLLAVLLFVRYDMYIVFPLHPDNISRRVVYCRSYDNPAAATRYPPLLLTRAYPHKSHSDFPPGSQPSQYFLHH